MSYSVWPYGQQPTRLLCPQDSPGKNTGVGCHFLLQCIKVKSESEVAQLCPTPSDPFDCSLPGSSVHGILQARVLEWDAIANWSNRKIWPWSTEWSRAKANMFCQENALVIANTLFQQHKRRLYTWTSPDGQYQNQIDYILWSQRWKSSIQSAKTRPGA